MDSAPEPRLFEIKKYPNRRYYNVTRSRHDTFDDLYEYVRTGNRIHITDSKTGKDITNVVLTQIILERDPPKLDLFPASLLHQAIQANQQMVRKFVDQYFAQAVDAFSQSRRAFEEFLKKSGFSPLTPSAPFDWVRMLFPGMGGSNGPGPTQAGSPNEDEAVRALREQVAKLSEQLSQLRTDSNNRPAPKGGARKKRK